MVLLQLPLPPFLYVHLFPHKTVLENLTIAPINVKGISKADAEKKAIELLDRVGLTNKSKSYHYLQILFYLKLAPPIDSNILKMYFYQILTVLLQLPLHPFLYV